MNHPWLEMFQDGLESSGQQQRWKAVLRAALHVPRRITAHDAIAGQHPLAAMLFLLDGLAVLKHLHQGSKGNPQQHNTVADDAEAFEQCAMYISEMYIPLASSDGAAEENYVVPFNLDRAVTGNITSASGSATEEPAVAAFQSQLKQALGATLDWLSDWSSNEGKSLFQLAGLDSLAGKPEALDTPQDVSPETRPTSVHSQTSSLDLLDTIPMTVHHQGQSIIESLLSGNGTLALPTLDSSLQSNIAQALSDKRYTPLHTPTTDRAFAAQQESRNRSSYSVGLTRWILASLLRHYLGASEFGQQQHKTTNHVRYAREEADDLAIRAYFSRPKRFSTSDSVISLASPSIASIAGGYVDPATRAEIAAVRRDDKLRWLFGESVNSRSANPMPPAHVAGRAPFPPSLAGIPTFPTLRTLSRDEEGGREVIDTQEAQFAVGLGVTPPRSPHRRAHSAGNVSPRYRHTPTLSADSTLASPSKLHHNQHNYLNYISRSKTSFDSLASLNTNDSPREFSSSASGARLARIDSSSTYDSHTRLLKDSRSTLTSSGRPLLPTLSNAGALPNENALPSPAPFATMQRVLSKDYDDAPRLRSESYGSTQSEPTPLQPNKNTNLLTAEEKQNLVKKNRKLRAVLGEAPYVDTLPASKSSNNNKYTLPTTPLSTRSMSEETYETASSTMDSPPLRTGYTDDLDLTSSGLSRDPSSAAQGSYTDTFTSPEMALKSPAVDSERKEVLEEPPWSPLSTESLNEARASQRDMLSPEMQAKEARRRKLMKVQAFLGERVPVSALLEDVGPLADEKTPTKRRAPKLLSRASSKIGGKLSKPRSMSRRYSADDLKDLGTSTTPRSGIRGENRLSKRKSHLHSIAAYPAGAFDDLESEAYTEWQNVTPDLLSVTTRGVPEAVKSATVTAGGEPTIAAIRRARKLEKVFGSLPPQQLYSQKRPPQQLLPLKKKLLPRDDRPRSSFVQPEEELDDEDRSILRGSSNARPGVYRRTSNSSLYRSSIASLRYLAECKDDRLLQEFAKVVLAEESEVSEAETNAGRARSQPETAARDSDHGDISDDEEEEDGIAGPARLPDIASSYGKKGKAVQHEPHTEGRSSHETDTGSSPPFTFGGRTSNLSFIHPTGSNARFQSVRGHRFTGRESVLSGVTAISNADSAIDVASRRSTSRASSRSSMDSVRIQFKRAHKLAHMFGTTRGEVFNRVLDDIVADIQELDEDEELSDTERREVLENVAALRAAL